MSVDQMVGMMTELFPYFNMYDKYGMLNDIFLVQPAKFAAVLPLIEPLLATEDRSFLEKLRFLAA